MAWSSHTSWISIQDGRNVDVKAENGALQDIQSNQ